MKSKPVRVGRAIVLSILFFVTVFSLAGVEQNPDSMWTTAHIQAGSLMLAGSIVHLLTNLDWIKAVFFRSGKNLQKHVRQNRCIDLGLLITGSLCTLAGTFWLIDPIERLDHLHTMSGMFMIVLIGIHMLLHWQWMVNTIHQLRDPKFDETHKSLPRTMPIE